MSNVRRPARLPAMPSVACCSNQLLPATRFMRKGGAGCPSIGGQLSGGFMRCSSCQVCGVWQCSQMRQLRLARPGLIGQCKLAESAAGCPSAGGQLTSGFMPAEEGQFIERTEHQGIDAAVSKGRGLAKFGSLSLGLKTPVRRAVRLTRRSSGRPQATLSAATQLQR